MIERALERFRRQPRRGRRGAEDQHRHALAKDEAGTAWWRDRAPAFHSEDRDFFSKRPTPRSCCGSHRRDGSLPSPPARPERGGSDTHQSALRLLRWRHAH